MSIEVPAGTVMSGYRVERLIGRGATGAVYLARDEHLDRAVALKVLAPELTRDQRFRERFLRRILIGFAVLLTIDQSIRIGTSELFEPSDLCPSLNAQPRAPKKYKTGVMIPTRPEAIALA